MPYPRALTPAEEADLVQRYLTGWSADRLAARFGCGKTAVRRCLIRQGVERRPPGQAPKEGVDTATIVSMRDAGATWFSIVDATGLSYNAVRKRYLKAKGLPLVASGTEGTEGMTRV